MGQRKKRSRLGIGRASKDAAAAQAAALDVFVEAGIATDGVRLVELGAIGDRAGVETRSLNAAHVIALARSIHALGMLEPIVTDSASRLLAGGHRRAACGLLSDEDRPACLTELCGSVAGELLTAAGELPEGTGEYDPERTPVRVMGFDATLEPGRALGVEAAENEHRRDYSRADIKRLLERLEREGYRIKPGRPKKDEKAAMPVVEAVVGKSRVQIWRILKGKAETVSSETVSIDRDKEALRRVLSRYMDRHVEATPQRRATEMRRVLEWLKRELGEE